MNKAVIQQTLDNLYNQGKITLKEKARIGNLPIEEALEVDLISQELSKELEKLEELEELESITSKLDNKKPKTDSDLLKDLLIEQKLQLNKLELIRANLSKLVWWLVVIPIIATIIILFAGSFD